jgi:hypothetical protein
MTADLFNNNDIEIDNNNNIIDTNIEINNDIEINNKPIPKKRGRPKGALNKIKKEKPKKIPKKLGRPKGSLKENAICRNPVLKKEQTKFINAKYYYNDGHLINKISYYKRVYNLNEPTKEQYEKLSETNLIKLVKTMEDDIMNAKLQKCSTKFNNSLNRPKPSKKLSKEIINKLFL